MKSQPINKFEGVNLDLTIEDALRIVKGEKDAIERLQEHISGHLSAAGIAFKGAGDPKKKPTVKCDICEGMFYARGLKVHQRKAHPEAFLRDGEEIMDGKP